ncbi:putative Transcriptional regulator, GntR family [Desulfamplus magnetovallimortis]|uniref:Putative Transcriptional regulator, GntR family n=1 Tax=Desulfamplus magnetovallimortis TaxID=1246637 RepID=A0A1W1HJN7_9BACT|nr:GntR family transcriptional regulator [Desulfamplus magnetovallimortis]SLM32578.1 putative Transcriptional regulator, GntR family [Desulfamplus magnetovallimortis]
MAEHRNLTLHVYDQIKEMMFNYDIVPGQRLVFVDLAKALGVSRTPVNNALSILAKEGYLDFVPNQGYSVHKLTHEEADALYELKNILEVGTIRKAIENCNEEKIKALEIKKNAYSLSVKNRVSRSLFVLDMNFHATICEMAGNPYIVEKYKDIYQHIFLRFRIEYLQIDRIYDIIEEHEQLFHAIRIMDVEWASDLIKQHNDASLKNLSKLIFNK